MWAFITSIISLLLVLAHNHELGFPAIELMIVATVIVIILRTVLIIIINPIVTIIVTLLIALKRPTKHLTSRCERSLGPDT